MTTEPSDGFLHGKDKNMGTIFKTLVPSKYLEDAETTQYTAVRCTAAIDKFTATNVSGANVTMSVWLVPVGGSPSASNLIVNARQIAPGATYTMPELVGHPLSDGESIATVTNAASSITIRVGGREITG